MKTCNYNYSCSEYCNSQFMTENLKQLSVNWPIMVWFLSGLSLGLVYTSVCNNSLKLYHGEIIRPCCSDGHYRSTTCISSTLLISQNGCWGAHQECCFVNCNCDCACEQTTCVCVLVCVVCFCLCLTVCAQCGCVFVIMLACVVACTCSEHSYVVFGGVCACM